MIEIEPFYLSVKIAGDKKDQSNGTESSKLAFYLCVNYTNTPNILMFVILLFYWFYFLSLDLTVILILFLILNFILISH